MAPVVRVLGMVHPEYLANYSRRVLRIASNRTKVRALDAASRRALIAVDFLDQDALADLVSHVSSGKSWTAIPKEVERTTRREQESSVGPVRGLGHRRVGSGEVRELYDRIQRPSERLNVLLGQLQGFWSDRDVQAHAVSCLGAAPARARSLTVGTRVRGLSRRWLLCGSVRIAREVWDVGHRLGAEPPTPPSR